MDNTGSIQAFSKGFYQSTCFLGYIGGMEKKMETTIIGLRV